MIKVIIVDDSRIFRKMLKAVFGENGDEVIGEAGNGQELLDMLESCTPDLITLDITMPVVDGVEGFGRSEGGGVGEDNVIILHLFIKKFS